MSFNPGGSGGSSSIATSTDVALSTIQNDQVLTYNQSTDKWANHTPTTLTIRWTGTTWPTRPTTAPFGVLYLSTNDPDAPPPTDPNLETGDVWRRHPDAG